jgi:hypothetical protein
MKRTYFDHLVPEGDDIYRTISEDDYSFYMIKGKLQITNTEIKDNDFLMSATTNSEVNMQNMTIKGIVSNGPVIQVISSILRFQNVSLTNITANSSNQNGGFFKLAILNKSTFQVTNTSLTDMIGPLL